ARPTRGERRTMTDTTVPTFSLAQLREGEQRDALRDCLTRVGTFYLTDYGATPEDHARATDAAMEFFTTATPQEKARMAAPDPAIRRGYSGLEAESTAQVTNTGQYTDYSMSFSMGVDRNLFPSAGFEQVWTAYFDQLYGISKDVARVMLDAVDADPPGGVDALLDADPVFRLRYFPEVPQDRVAEAEPLRMAPHYDLSVLTLI